MSINMSVMTLLDIVQPITIPTWANVDNVSYSMKVINAIVVLPFLSCISQANVIGWHITALNIFQILPPAKAVQEIFRHLIVLTAVQVSLWHPNTSAKRVATMVVRIVMRLIAIIVHPKSYWIVRPQLQWLLEL
jgi:hypothetical protein